VRRGEYDVKDLAYFRQWLSEIIDHGDHIVEEAKTSPYIDPKVIGWSSRAENFLVEVFGTKSDFYKAFREVYGQGSALSYSFECALELVKAIYRDLTQGRLTSLRSMIEAEMFSDFADIAERVLESGSYGPAAALMVGVLERGLRDIAAAHDVSAPGADLPGLNARIAQAGIYTKLRQKEVQYWIDIRNKAAHGEFNEFTHNDVRKMLDGVRDLLETHLPNSNPNLKTSASP
jgi:hypothetical protein